MFAYFQRRIDPFAPYDDTVAPPSRLGAFIWHYSRPVLPWLLIGGASGAAVAVFDTMLMYFLGRIVDMASTTDAAVFFETHWRELLVMALVVGVLRPVASVINVGALNVAIFPNMPSMIRWRTHRWVVGQPLSFFQNDFAGRIATKVMQTGRSVREVLVSTIEAVWQLLIFFLSALWMIGEASGVLTLPLLVWVVLYVAIACYFLPRLKAMSKEQSDALSLLNGRIVDGYSNIQTLKLFAHGRREDDYVREAITDQTGKFAGMMIVVAWLELALMAINTLLVLGASALALWLWSTGETSVGTLAMTVGLVTRLWGLSFWIMFTATGIFENIGTIADGMETIARARTLTDPPSPKALPEPKGALAFENISFQYGREKGGVDGLDLRVKPGERVGLVGRSGAGKSTLVNLALRFHDVEGGRVTLDGMDVREVAQSDLRRRISVVTQDPALLHRSVMDNILYGRPDAGAEAAMEAARRARAHDFILDLEDPKGRKAYEAHIGERGVKLSGGQRQRLAIARAILKDAPILVLDEATSALDSEVEAEIQAELAGLMEGKTVIAIAHRLSTIAHLDRIVVLDGGRIVEEGTHAALLEAGGLYAGFWSRQSGGFLGLDEAQAAE